MIGQTVLHYRITGQLGSGGMGIVYEAEDINLRRRVALKFLPPELSRDQNSLDRFLLEARTASALNHPNICTIYAVEKAGEQSFIAMELLEGETLDRRLAAGIVPLDRLLDWSVQLADALDAAHAKGIIHRDIKPANLFITQRGQVKVLDFGLAKLVRPEMEMETIGATLDNAVAHLTSPGATVGTIAYMSPEQARGESLDSRTDMFSLGVVLYQMATGRLPFSEATTAVIFHAILELDPVPALQLNATLPPKLEEIIDKSLEKDRDLRYQSAADLRGDLKRLKRDTESGRKATAADLTSGSAPRMPSASAAAPVLSDPQKSRSAQVSEAPQKRLTKSLVAAIAIVLLAAMGYGLYSLIARSRPAPFQTFTVEKVTEGGKSVLAAISPDGKYILNLVRDNGLASLWLRNVPTNSNVQVQPSADVYYNGLRFSPEGNYFYFVRSDPGNTELKFLYRAPLLGGMPQKLASDVDSNITFSPDGKRFAFLRYDNPEAGKYQLIVRPVEGIDAPEQVLTSGSNAEALSSPTWSPDGKTIICNELHAGYLQTLVAVDTSSGQHRPFFAGEDQYLISPVWLPDGSGMLGLLREVNAYAHQAQIAFISYPQAKVSRITRDTNIYSDLSIAANGLSLATILNEERWNFFVMPESGGNARVVAPSKGNTNFTWTADGQLIGDQDVALTRIDPATGNKSVTRPEEGN